MSGTGYTHEGPPFALRARLPCRRTKLHTWPLSPSFRSFGPKRPLSLVRRCLILLSTIRPSPRALSPGPLPSLNRTIALIIMSILPILNTLSHVRAVANGRCPSSSSATLNTAREGRRTAVRHRQLSQSSILVRELDTKRSLGVHCNPFQSRLLQVTCQRYQRTRPCQMMLPATSNRQTIAVASSCQALPLMSRTSYPTKSLTMTTTSATHPSHEISGKDEHAISRPLTQNHTIAARRHLVILASLSQRARSWRLPPKIQSSMASVAQTAQ